MPTLKGEFTVRDLFGRLASEPPDRVVDFVPVGLSDDEHVEFLEYKPIIVSRRLKPPFDSTRRCFVLQCCTNNNPNVEMVAGNLVPNADREILDYQLYLEMPHDADKGLWKFLDYQQGIVTVTFVPNVVSVENGILPPLSLN